MVPSASISARIAAYWPGWVATVTKRWFFGRGPDQRRSADVDLLDRLLVGHVVPADGRLEGVEVHRDEAERVDLEPFEGLLVVLVVAPGEDAGEDPRVERLDPAAEDLRKSRVASHVSHRHARLGEEPGGAAGADDLHVGVDEPAGKVDHAEFVGNRDQRPE